MNAILTEAPPRAESTAPAVPPALPPAARGPRVSAETVDDLAHVFKLLSDRHRLRIVLALAHDGPMHVAAIVNMLPGQSQPAVSHHLAEMRRAGMLRCDRRGKCNYYSLAPDYLCRLFEQFFREYDGELTLGDFCLHFAPKGC